MVRGGKIGEVKAGYACHASVMYPNGIGRDEPCAPPEGLDWDRWLGPRAMRPYQKNLAPYYFRWWSGFSSQMGNWGVHYLDGMRWLTGEIMLCGTKGTLCLDENRYQLTPAKAGQFQKWDPAFEAESYELAGDTAFGDLGTKEDTTQNLIDDFVSSVRDRKPTRCSTTITANRGRFRLVVGKREWVLAKSMKRTGNRGADNEEDKTQTECAKTATCCSSCNAGSRDRARWRSGRGARR